MSPLQYCVKNKPPHKLRAVLKVHHLSFHVPFPLSRSAHFNKELKNMSARSKDKVTAMFRRLFRSNKDNGNESGPSNSASSSTGGSPARRLLRGCRDTVSPADTAPPGSPGFTTAKSATVRKEDVAPPSGKTVRARRLMKEFKDLQR